MFDIKAKRFLTFYRHVLIAFLSNYLLFSAYDSFSCSVLPSSCLQRVKTVSLLFFWSCRCVSEVSWDFFSFFLSFFSLSVFLRSHSNSKTAQPDFSLLLSVFLLRFQPNYQHQRADRSAESGAQMCVKHRETRGQSLLHLVRFFERREKRSVGLQLLLPSLDSSLRIAPSFTISLPLFFSFFFWITHLFLSFFLSFWLKKVKLNCYFLCIYLFLLLRKKQKLQ